MPASVPPGVHLVKKTLVLSETGNETTKAKTSRQNEPNNRTLTFFLDAKVPDDAARNP